MTNTTYRRLERDLTLYDSQHEPLTVKVINLALIQAGETVNACQLTWQISPELYSQRVDSAGLFNLQPAVRGPMRLAEQFQPEPNLEIEARLRPELLPQLLEHATTIDEVVSYLLELAYEPADNPLLATESWLALSVKQAKGAVKIGYKTSWADGMLPTASAESRTRPSIFDDPVVVNRADMPAEVDLEGQSILSKVAQFFQQDEWPYTQNDPHVLATQFQGANGQFNCYAQAREAEQQFVFYSVCSIKAPAAKYFTVAEFLTRANYGMIIGNFEFDFRDGEIRYKTSIDVEGDTLTLALIKQVVYPNVLMMDRYLSGLMKVIYGGLSPEAAIELIEG